MLGQNAQNPWLVSLSTIDAAENLQFDDSNFILQGLACWLLDQGKPADLYFWRDNSGLEADLLFEKEGRLQLAEIMLLGSAGQGASK